MSGSPLSRRERRNRPGGGVIGGNTEHGECVDGLENHLMAHASASLSSLNGCVAAEGWVITAAGQRRLTAQRRHAHRTAGARKPAHALWPRVREAEESAPRKIVGGSLAGEVEAPVKPTAESKHTSKGHARNGKPRWDVRHEHNSCE